MAKALDPYTTRRFARMARRWQHDNEQHMKYADGTTDPFYLGRMGIMCAFARVLEAELRTLSRKPARKGKRNG